MPALQVIADDLSNSGPRPSSARATDSWISAVALRTPSYTTHGSARGGSQSSPEKRLLQFATADGQAPSARSRPRRGRPPRRPARGRAPEVAPRNGRARARPARRQPPTRLVMSTRASAAAARRRPRRTRRPAQIQRVPLGIGDLRNDGSRDLGGSRSPDGRSASADVTTAQGRITLAPRRPRVEELGRATGPEEESSPNRQGVPRDPGTRAARGGRHEDHTSGRSPAANSRRRQGADSLLASAGSRSCALARSASASPASTRSTGPDLTEAPESAAERRVAVGAAPAGQNRCIEAIRETNSRARRVAGYASPVNTTRRGD